MLRANRRGLVVKSGEGKRWRGRWRGYATQRVSKITVVTVVAVAVAVAVAVGCDCSRFSLRGCDMMWMMWGGSGERETDKTDSGR